MSPARGHAGAALPPSAGTERSPGETCAPESAAALARYGALQFALGAVALPLYVFLPAYYASRTAMPLATLGGLLLVSRLFDAVVDPVLGRVADRCLARGQAWCCIALASVPMLGGFGVLVGPERPTAARYRLKDVAAVLDWLDQIEGGAA